MSGALPDDAGRVLLPLAREAIAEHLRLQVGVEDGFEAPYGAPEAPNWEVDEHPAWLDAPGATFVTLTIDGELRGCIGTLEAFRSLEEDVRRNAVNAAFRDPRFAPLGPEEFDLVRVEVSVLSAPVPLDDVRSEAEAIARLRPGVDGVILRSGSHRATFLPQVWDHIPAPKDFLAHLRRKAGLRPDHWDEHTRIERYTVRAWEEE
ncbi:AmmeMemoRadiSam system protein A [Raineyella fluvialis]|uniref:AmmeMemoRadiSam system protein A n=1 Tax=Raineyella fluvialis TaxID=2662261 RepID=A0A5Q2FCG3_9ACTN|nr:AmmeMemoRadiSam system protein A [Raineyella fluvialis]QGF23437.1 AmmeMemoRadiSam system protein A [Raineyella fluvialis]